MKRASRLVLVITFTILTTLPMFASDASGGGNLFPFALLLFVGILLLSLVLVVGGSLVKVEAKKAGVALSDDSIDDDSTPNKLFGPKLPDHLAGKRVHVLKEGYDINLDGAASSKVTTIRASRYAVKPTDFRGIAPIPKVSVEVGNEIKAGDPIFYDKINPDMKFVSPVSGEVIEINRGAKRAISDIVILADKENSYRSVPAFDLEDSDRASLVNHLYEYGAWPLINERPFDKLADREVIPENIFISTFDSAPLAPDYSMIIKGQEAAFQKGLDVLNHLTNGKVFLGLDGSIASKNPFASFNGADVHYFLGKHPAGNVGVQIHHIAPIKSGTTVWTLNVQDVVVVGNLLLHNRYDATKTIAIAGGAIKDQQYIRTFAGASVESLLKDKMEDGNVRVISGDPLSGKQISAQGYLNSNDDQLTVLPEGDKPEFMGWLTPIRAKPSVSKTYPNFLFPSVKYNVDTNMNGERRAFVVSGQYEKVLPMDIYPQHLMKAIMINDIERMEGLGILELSEEDLALCEFVCTSKMPLQKILREGLDVMLEQS